MNKVLSWLKEHETVIRQVESLIPMMEISANRIVEAIRNGGKVFFMGNGGSAADAQHLAAELIGRFKAERRALPAISLSTDTSILTCLSNDYSYDIVFSRQLEALCKPQDVVIGISTSGNSANVIHGIDTAKQIGAYTIGLTGASGGKLAAKCDACFCIPSQTVARIQEAHIFIGHSICELVELAFVSDIASEMNGSVKYA